jgi:hypothetical protein
MTTAREILAECMCDAGWVAGTWLTERNRAAWLRRADAVLAEVAERGWLLVSAAEVERAAQPSADDDKLQHTALTNDAAELNHLREAAATLDKVFGETCDALGCDHDNEAALMAIHHLRDAHARLVRGLQFYAAEAAYMHSDGVFVYDMDKPEYGTPAEIVQDKGAKARTLLDELAPGWRSAEEPTG